MQIIIDLHPGNPGEEQNIQTLLEELSKTGYAIQEGQNPKVSREKAKLIIADTDSKRFYFLNSYFPAVYGFMGKQERPVSLTRMLKNIAPLLVKHDSALLKSMYSEEFQEHQKR